MTRGEDLHRDLPEEARTALAGEDALDTAVALLHERLVDEWGCESFPASDPPARWAGRDLVAAGARA